MAEAPKMAPGLKSKALQAATKITTELDYFSNMEAHMWKSKVKEELIANEKLMKNKVIHGFKYWDVYDFKGMYHKNRIKSKFPIPGTQITFEEARQAAEIEKVNQMGKNIELLEQGFQNASKRRGKVQLELEQIKSNSGERFRTMQQVHRLLDQQQSLLRKIEGRHKLENDCSEAMETMNKQLLSQVFQTVHAGDFDTLKVMMIRGLANVHTTRPPFSNSLLMEACSILSVSMVGFLLANGANPDQSNQLGDRSMHVCWQRLLKSRESGTEEQIQSDYSNTQAIVEILLEFDANVNACNRFLETPLHLAAKTDAVHICFLLLLAGARGDGKDSENREPVDLAIPGSQSHRLLLNWHGIKSAAKREEFIKLWTKRLRDPIHPSNISTQKPVSQLLKEIDILEWGRQSSALMRKGILVSAAAMETMALLKQVPDASTDSNLKELQSHLAQVDQENSVMSNTSAASELHSTGLSQLPWIQVVPSTSTDFAEKEQTQQAFAKPKAVSIAQSIRSAQVKYTAKYRAKIHQKRKHQKPSARTLSLTEYLVGTEDRQKAERKDRQNQRKQFIRMDNRRTRAGLGFLKDQYKGNCTVVHGNIRPSTVSALGRSDGKSFPRREQEAAQKSLEFTTNVRNPSGEAQLAKRQNTLKEKQKMQELETLTLRYHHTSSSVDQRTSFNLGGLGAAGDSLSEESVALSGPARSRPSVLENPALWQPSQRRRKDIAVDGSQESKLKQLVRSLSQSEDLAEAHHGVPATAKGIRQAKKEAQEAKESAMQSAKVDEAGTTKSTLLDWRKQKQLVQKAMELREDSVTVSQSNKEKIRDKNPINDPKVLPPKFSEHQVFTHVKRMKTGVLKAFNKVELLDAFARVQASHFTDPGFIPGGVKDAILETVYARGPITIEQLFDEFSVFVVGNVSVDLRRVLRAIADQLLASNKYMGIHPGLLEYGDQISQPPASRMPLRDKPCGDPWAKVDRRYREQFGIEANPMRSSTKATKITKHLTLKMMGQI